MTQIPEALVGVGRHHGVGFAPVMEFSGWLVAASRRNPAVSPADFRRVQRHNETNEVFILTQGKAQMLVMDGDTAPGTPHLFPMEPNVVYNVQQGVWHATFLSEDAHIIIFERANTSSENSDVYELDEATIATILAQVDL
jgi:ureidoglycolate hydrolase